MVSAALRGVFRACVRAIRVQLIPAVCGRSMNVREEDVVPTLEREVLEAFAEHPYGARILADGIWLTRFNSPRGDAEGCDWPEFDQAMRHLVELRLVEDVRPGVYRLADAGWVLVHDPEREVLVSLGPRTGRQGVLDVLVTFEGRVSRQIIESVLDPWGYDAHSVREAIGQLERAGCVSRGAVLVWITQAGRDEHAREASRGFPAGLRVVSSYSSTRDAEPDED